MIVGAETKTRRSRARARMVCRVSRCTTPEGGATSKRQRKSHHRTMMDPDAEMVIPRAISGRTDPWA